MVQQASLASTEYPKGVNEFIKAGFTPLDSVKVKPPRVAQSPVQFECVVKDIIELGQEGGAGNLFICEIVMIHVQDYVLNTENKIDPLKMDQVARCGGDYYTRVNPDSMFVVPKPIARLGIGIDALPEFIRTSPLLTGNELAMMGNVEKLPEQAELSALESSPDFMRLKDQSAQLDKWEMAKSLLKTGQPTLALTWLMFGDQQI